MRMRLSVYRRPANLVVYGAEGGPSEAPATLIRVLRHHKDRLKGKRRVVISGRTSRLLRWVKFFGADAERQFADHIFGRRRH